MQTPIAEGLIPKLRIAVARDEAFNFTYRANIDALKRVGDVLFFSPLRDARLPLCDWLYLPGGYPELFVAQLTANASMRSSILEYVENGGKTFAECGGFMYLCRSIDKAEMCGVFPFSVTMNNARLHLGYREIRVKDSSNTFISELPFRMTRGHEFHYSSIDLSDEAFSEENLNAKGVTIYLLQASAKGQPVDTPIYRYKNVIAGYTHWYWAENVCF